MYNFRIN